MAERTYRCSNCLEQTVQRGYDVSHISQTCAECGEFARFINNDVFEQYRTFEDSPPEHLDWGRLSRAEKFLVSNGVVREGRAIEDFDIEES
jgi:hypothetical protein